jgi:hypothetical protein
MRKHNYGPGLFLFGLGLLLLTWSPIVGGLSSKVRAALSRVPVAERALAPKVSLIYGETASALSAGKLDGLIEAQADALNRCQVTLGPTFGAWKPFYLTINPLVRAELNGSEKPEDLAAVMVAIQRGLGG